jgi:hypothetical protein
MVVRVIEVVSVSASVAKCSGNVLTTDPPKTAVVLADEPPFPHSSDDRTDQHDLAFCNIQL